MKTVSRKNSWTRSDKALQAYKLEHGAYPAKLSALVPSDLSQVPNDPFALSGPLRYKLSNSQYILYSIGPDGKDDGGTPIINPAFHNNSHYSGPSSRGDIVAGINLF